MRLFLLFTSLPKQTPGCAAALGCAGGGTDGLIALSPAAPQDSTTEECYKKLLHLHSKNHSNLIPAHFWPQYLQLHKSNPPASAFYVQTYRTLRGFFFLYTWKIV